MLLTNILTLISFVFSFSSAVDLVKTFAPTAASLITIWYAISIPVALEIGIVVYMSYFAFFLNRGNATVGASAEMRESENCSKCARVAALQTW